MTSSSSSSPSHSVLPTTIALHTRSTLESNPALSHAITHLVNDSFARSKEQDEGKWDNSIPRFDNVEGLYSLLGGEADEEEEEEETGVVAVMFEGDGEFDKSDERRNGVNPWPSSSSQTTQSPIACAAAIPWRGGYGKEGADTETGWEMKIVSVRCAPRYQRRGLAVRLLAFLEEYLVGLERGARLREGDSQGGSVEFWILAAECQVGGYWRRRGYVDVRRTTEGPGVWSCRERFEMLVLKRRVEF